MRSARIAGLVLVGACARGEPVAPVIVATAQPASVEPPAMAIPPAPTPTSAGTTDVSPSPMPSADFLVHADIVKAGKRAIGKVARIEVRRDHYTSGKQFTAVPCADSGSIRLRYTPVQRDLVRAMVGTCALVSFRIVAIRGGLVEGEIAHVANLAPKRATPAPPGADYASIDDAILAGTEAKGKIVEASVSVYDADPKLFWVHDCGRKDSYVFVVPDATNQPLFAQLRNYRIRGCGPAHLLVSDPDFAATWNDGSMQRPRAELVSVP